MLATTDQPPPFATLYTPRWINWAMQASHRLGIVAVLALIGAVALLAAVKPFTPALAAAAGCADVAMCSALLTMSFVARRSPAWREARGLVWFNGAVLGLSLLMMLVARLDVLHDDLQSAGDDARAEVQQWTAPTAPPIP